MKICLLMLSTLVCGCWSDVRDKTRIPESKGSEVVEAVVNRIRESCLFSDDKLFLRRLAYVETRDGINPGTYRSGYDGGIWQISRAKFDKTHVSNNSISLYGAVKTDFHIDWSFVQWSDLRKPLYSGLAAALYLSTLPEQVPQLKTEQSRFYAKYFNNDPTAESKFTAGTNTFDIVCRQTNLDLAFLVDASSSLSPEDFDRAKLFAQNVVDNFQIGSDSVRVAFVTFSSGYTSEFSFNQFVKKDDLKNAIDGILKTEGRTDTDLALDYASEELFTSKMGSREGSSKVILLITDGKSTKSFKTIPAALRARNKGIVIFAIGVGIDVDLQELRSVANKPECTHVIQLKEYSDLNALVDEIQQVSCIAPTVLKQGTYTYPCSQGEAYQITSRAASTMVTVTTTDGMVNIYGSLSNPTPNEAGHAFYSNAIPGTSAVILINDNHKPVYFNVSSNGSPFVCNGNYTINIDHVKRVEPNTLVTCIDYDVSRPCSVVEVYSHLYKRIPRPYSFSNPCYRGLAGFKPHPKDQRMFLYCGSNQTVYVFQCPPHHIYDMSSTDCAVGEPSTTTQTPSPPTTSTSTRQTTSTSTRQTSTSTSTSVPTTTLPTTKTTELYTSPTATETTTKTRIRTTTIRLKTAATTPQPVTASTEPSTTLPSTYAPTKTSVDHTLLPSVKVPTFGSSGPCTEYHISQNGGVLLFPYAQDKTKYIKCTKWPNFGYVKSCPSGRMWDQSALTCVYENIVIDPTKNTFDKLPNPCANFPNTDNMFFPHPTNKHMYIHCDQYGDAFEKTCPQNMVWHHEVLQCIPMGLVMT